MVGPSPTYGVGEDATKNQTKGVPERLAHPVHGKGRVAPWALGEGVGDETYRRGQTHGYGHAQKCPEEDYLNTRLGQPDGYGEYHEKETPRNPHQFGPYDVCDCAKH